VGRTQPDLDLIKQVEQVKRFVLAGACQGFGAKASRSGGVLAFSIYNFFLSLMFRCKEQQKQL
jgi:hypothetical protein